MKIPPPSFALHPRVLVLLCCFLPLGCSVLQAQNQTITGDLSVSGSLDISGPVFNLGTWTDNTAKLGVNVTYAEDASHAASLSLAATRPITRWQWLRAASATDTTIVPQMTLGSGNALTLYDVTLPTPNAAIVLDPIFGSTFTTSVSMEGTNNTMPNQEIDDATSVLTVALADDRYVLRGTGNTLSLGYQASAAGANSTALGAYSQASGTESTALSYAAHATGQYSVALGNSSAATGVQSTALGADSAASGDASLTLGYSSLASAWGTTTIGNGSQATGIAAEALGAYSVASGPYALALGFASNATGPIASALGSYSLASGTSAMALGTHSVSSGDLALALGHYTTVSADVAVGLGYGSTASGYGSTALGYYSVASGSYSGSIGQTTADSLFQFTVGRNNVIGGSANDWVPTEDLFSVGNGNDPAHRSNAFSVKKNGDATVGGTLTVASKIVVSGPIIIQPQGDLLMGEFTAQPSPAP